MCRNCGCGEAVMQHAHSQPRAEGERRTVHLQHSLLAANDRQASHNRNDFRAAGILVVNLLSSPGSGKTRLLERTLDALAARLRLAVVVGDVQTDNDARRLSGRGAPVVPITTGALCHLEADMVARACRTLDAADLDLLFIENVGNLVCPAAFDLGEELRIVLLSTTEGEDKPLKYPLAFKTAQVVLVTKTDLAEPAGFDRAVALENIRQVAPQAIIIELSARSGEGMQSWFDFLESRVARPAAAR